jgi:hypothetical protein
MNRIFVIGSVMAAAFFLVSVPYANCADSSASAGNGGSDSQGSTVWTQSAECSKCHAKYVDSMKDEKLLIGVHVRAGIDNCSSCHDVPSLKEIHVNAVAPKPVIRQRRYPSEFCLNCHGTRGDLAKKTANTRVLTDVKGRVVNPHDLPKTPTHAKAGECANCHRMHKPSVNSAEFCYGCHHKREFACAECHSERG